MSDLAVVLLSGGLDSATTATQAARDGFELHALSFDYGQRHAAELAAASRVAESIPVAEHKTLQVDLRSFGGSALTDQIPVPKGRDATEIATGIPVTYVPARNTIFLSFALAWAEVLGAADIFIGVNALDYSGYPDCRPEYLEAFERLASLATKAGVEGSRPLRIHAPLMDMTKSDIISLGVSLGVNYAQTVSCYEATEDGEACGNCDSCILRRRGFSEAGIPDPTRYQAQLAG